MPTMSQASSTQHAAAAARLVRTPPEQADRIDLRGPRRLPASTGACPIALAHAMRRLLNGRALDTLSIEDADHRFILMTPHQAADVRRTVARFADIGLDLRGDLSSRGLIIDATLIARRGFDATAARQLASVIADMLEMAGDDAIAVRARRQVRALCERFRQMQGVWVRDGS
ncbi:serine hydroxymethyltransferase [Salinisphaera hydrothermalis C41B8]|uniref:Serine hydroxymethyltransferase n=2 Tax=Salinisphaera TaxID=180541 RepID=A0A084IQZ6_SALHC|nr:serine hydroxymethyltransferase [Salinisphaera hydrothermalis C41B8]